MVTPITVSPSRTIINDDVSISGTNITVRDLYVTGVVTITNLHQSILSGIYASGGFIIKGDVGAGVYGNEFNSLHTGLNSSGPAIGFDIYTVDPEDPARVNANTFTACSARFCTTVGVKMDLAATNTFIGMYVEACAKGMSVSNCLRVTMNGGHFESNTTDIELLAGTSYFRVVGANLASETKITGVNKLATGNVFEEDDLFQVVGTFNPSRLKSKWFDFIKADNNTITVNGG